MLPQHLGCSGILERRATCSLIASSMRGELGPCAVQLFSWNQESLIEFLLEAGRSGEFEPRELPISADPYLHGAAPLHRFERVWAMVQGKADEEQG